MAIAKINKIHILGYKSEQEPVLAFLQETGLVEVTAATRDLLPKTGRLPDEDLSDLDNRLRSLKEAIDILGLYAAERTPFPKSLFKVRPIVEPDEIEEAAESGNYQKILAEVKERRAEIIELENQTKRLSSDLESLRVWKNLDLVIGDLSGSIRTRLFLGVANQSDYAEFRREATDKNFPLFLNTVHQTKKECRFALICLVEHREEVEEMLRRHNIHIFVLPESVRGEAVARLTIRESLNFFEENKKSAQKEIKKAVSAMVALVPQRVLLMGLYDHFFNRRNRLFAVPQLGASRQVFLLEGWIRAKDLENLKSSLSKFPALAVFSREAFPSEDVPVVLENKPYIEPFEIITSLYGLPARYSVDPTPFLAPFFFIFFGLCLTDAGYGLIMVIAALIFLRKLKFDRAARKILHLVLLGGISTVILGALVGGFFGVPIKPLMLFDPLQNPLVFLIIALSLGFVQVELGLLIKMSQDLKQKKFADALLVWLAWILFLPSLALIFVKIPWAKYVVFITAASIVLFSQRQIKNILGRIGAGLYSLYGIAGYFSDVISYSRLLALGLSTSVIAMVINTLSRQTLNIPLVGIIVAVLIFIFGHLANLAVNTLSGFVHSARLQYIEFFGKFFIGGGRSFAPFKKEKIYL